MAQHGIWSTFLPTTEFSVQFMLQPCHILLAILIGWANERQQRIIEAGETTGSENGTIDCRERLGGMLKYYHRRVA